MKIIIRTTGRKSTQFEKQLEILSRGNSSHFLIRKVRNFYSSLIVLNVEKQLVNSFCAPIDIISYRKTCLARLCVFHYRRHTGAFARMKSSITKTIENVQKSSRS